MSKTSELLTKEQSDDILRGEVILGVDHNTGLWRATAVGHPVLGTGRSPRQAIEDMTPISGN